MALVMISPPPVHKGRQKYSPSIFSFQPGQMWPIAQVFCATCCGGGACCGGVASADEDEQLSEVNIELPPPPEYAIVAMPWGNVKVRMSGEEEKA